ncbi:hypothetical protein JHK84_040188 [Glycine max]|nr:hypothetical protein JHK86_039977 [Glycine max]KAG4965577.1 hypothetical protein JHK85_040552 [Glycine max]KAG5121848.1 hypothetical protein JHK84_040188 [Glycine max]
MLSNKRITFSAKNPEGIKPHDDYPMLIVVITNEFNAEKVLIEQGSLVNIIYLNVYMKMEMLRENYKLA